MPDSTVKIDERIAIRLEGMARLFYYVETIAHNDDWRLLAGNHH